MEQGLKVINSTEIRKKWSEFIDEVTKKLEPIIVSRNNKSKFISISLEQTKFLLSVYRFKVLLTKERDNTITAELEEFDLIVNNNTKEMALENLAEELLDYAQDYIDDINLFYNAPNRKPHFPYILHVLIKEDVNEVIEMFDVKNKTITK